jgi:hypothetical protein
VLSAAGRYEALLLDDADLGTARELTIALEGSLELTVRVLAADGLRVGDPLRVELAPQDINVWPRPLDAVAREQPAGAAQPPM